MYALRIQTVIPQSRRLNMTLPADTPTGAAEVIVLTNVVQPVGTGYGLLQYLENRHWKPVCRRTAAEIDEQIRVERESWE